MLYMYSHCTLVLVINLIWHVARSNAPDPLTHIQNMTKRIAAVLKNDLGQLLPYTCQSTMSQCREWCESNIANFPKVLELGAKIVQVEITELGE
jgi:hypothetical protein